MFQINFIHYDLRHTQNINCCLNKIQIQIKNKLKIIFINLVVRKTVRENWNKNEI